MAAIMLTTRRVAWLLAAAVAMPAGAGSAAAGPADASCVYLALGCTAPTIHSPFDQLSQGLPPGEAVLPDPYIEVSPEPQPRRHWSRHLRHRARIAHRAKGDAS